MRRIAGIGWAVLASLSMTVVSFAHHDEQLNPERVAKDIEAVRLLSQLVPIENKSVEIIKTIMGTNTGVSEQDLGFGAKRVRLIQANNYTLFGVDVLTFNGTIGSYEISVKGDFKFYPRLGEQIIRVWRESGGPEFSESDYGLASRKRFDSVLQSYQRAVGVVLGEPSRLEIPAELKEHYEYLISPLHNSTVGAGGCGIRGAPLEGRIAINALVDAGRIDLIENVLRGYNPGGRVYAILALLRMKKEGRALSAGTQNTIDRLLDLPIKVSTCFGCNMADHPTAKQAILDMYDGRALLQ
jgi:hypothetical protein